MSEKIQDEFALSLGKEVPVSEIDKELRLLWEVDRASTKASLINLAVYSEAKDAILENSKQVRAITAEHACRALLIGIDRKNPETSIRAWVTAHCHLSQGLKSVCCEQISFQLNGRATGRLRNTVFSHLDSDLPLVFWWQGELSSIFSERLYSLIDQFIFDSSEWCDPQESIRFVAQAMEEVPTLKAIDMEWTRSYQIRYAIAGLFDDPMAIRSIEQINKIRIVVHPSHKMAGLQLLAWIVQRTGWLRSLDLGLMAESENDHYYFETHDGVDITAVIETDGNPEAGPISLVEMSSPECLVQVQRDPGSPRIRQRLKADGYEVDRCLPAGGDAVADLVTAQLSLGGKNSLYRLMMPVFLDLLGDDDSISRMSIR